MSVPAVARAGVDRHVRVVLPDHLRGPERGLDIVDGQHEGAGLARLRRFQDLRPAGVAVEGAGTELAYGIDMLWVGIERGEGDALGEQDAGHDLADAAEAGDDDVAVVFRHGVEGAGNGRPRR